jgi:NADP-dependent 3-hydroxy acid dehydrogenase YdfG
VAAKSVVLVTGASSGIGAAVAAMFVSRGYRVFGTTRGHRAGPAGVTMLPLDVRDDASARQCVDTLLAREGRLDVLVNNAGVILLGPVEEVPVSDARALFETNFWGVSRMVNAVLPLMRQQARGHVINIGSIAGSVAVPMNGYYAATKHALVAYSEALRHELKHTGVRVALVEPGDVRTAFWEGTPVAEPSIDAYTAVRSGVLRTLSVLRKDALSAEAVAEVVVHVAESKASPLRTPVGKLARRIPRMRAFMSQGMFEAGTRRKFGLPVAR